MIALIRKAGRLRAKILRAAHVGIIKLCFIALDLPDKTERNAGTNGPSIPCGPLSRNEPPVDIARKEVFRVTLKRELRNAQPVIEPTPVWGTVGRAMLPSSPKDS
jgi:hypothetical protein